MSEHDDFGGDLGVATDERPDAAQTFATILGKCAQEPRLHFKYVESGRKIVTHARGGKIQVGHRYNFLKVSVTRAGETHKEGIAVQVTASWVIDRSMTGQGEARPDEKPFVFRIKNGNFDQLSGADWRTVNINTAKWGRHTPNGRALAELLSETLYALFDLEKVVYGDKYIKERREAKKKDGGNGTP